MSQPRAGLLLRCSVLPLSPPAAAGTTCLRVLTAWHAAWRAAEAGTCRGQHGGQARRPRGHAGRNYTGIAGWALTLPAPGRMGSPRRGGWCGLQLAERCARLHRCPAPVSYLGWVAVVGRGRLAPLSAGKPAPALTHTRVVDTHRPDLARRLGPNPGFFRTGAAARSVGARNGARGRDIHMRSPPTRSSACRAAHHPFTSIWTVMARSGRVSPQSASLPKVAAAAPRRRRALQASSADPAASGVHCSGPAATCLMQRGGAGRATDQERLFCVRSTTDSCLRGRDFRQIKPACLHYRPRTL